MKVLMHKFIVKERKQSDGISAGFEVKPTKEIKEIEVENALDCEPL